MPSRCMNPLLKHYSKNTTQKDVKERRHLVPGSNFTKWARGERISDYQTGNKRGLIDFADTGRLHSNARRWGAEPRHRPWPPLRPGVQRYFSLWFPNIMAASSS